MDGYEIFAIRYASNAARRSSQNFLRGDPHDSPMPMDFFVWALRNKTHTVVVDTGFSEQRGREESYPVSRPVALGLKQAGIEPDSVDTVVLTHMHWDHAGNHELFPNARYHVQEREMHFCTGRCMCHPLMRNPYKADDVTSMVDKVFSGRVTFHAADSVVLPDLTVHWVGGHTAGLQVVRARTAHGFVVLASDAAHYYENLKSRRPYPLIETMQDILDGFDRVEALADSPAHIIPGHDPLVLDQYPAAAAGLEGIVRVDLPRLS